MSYPHHTAHGMGPMRYTGFMCLTHRMIALCALALCALAPVVHAQSLLPTQQRSDPSHIALTPSYPAPGDEVVARLNAHMIYAPSARIVWKRDGKVVQESIGGLEYRFTVEKVGQKINLEVIVYEESGNVLRKTLNQTIGAVSIVWEGLTYTPPLYAGRALHSPRSEVVLLALPTVANGAGGYVNKKDLVFNWHLHNETNPRYSGQGLDSIVAQGKNPFTPLNVSVHIEDKKGTVLAIGHIQVPITHPYVRFYREDPQFGIEYTRSLDRSFTLPSGKRTIYAEPYFMSTPTRTDTALTYDWRIGSQKLSYAGKVMLEPQGGAGASSIEVTVSNKALLEQRARGAVDVQFSSNTTNTTATDPETTPL